MSRSDGLTTTPAGADLTGSTGIADFPVGCITGFQTRAASANSTRPIPPRAADWEIGDTADLEVCATTQARRGDPKFPLTIALNTEIDRAMPA